MKSRELQKFGIPGGDMLKMAQAAIKSAAGAGMSKGAIHALVKGVAENPEAYQEDPHFAAFAGAFQAVKKERDLYRERETPAPWKQWGKGLEPSAVAQMERACLLPISVRGALMPDAHQGYGLPIGGVLATRGAVIPYAVGMDIACRMKLTILDLPVSALKDEKARLTAALEAETSFGVGATFRVRREHPVMDADWSISRITKSLRDKAWSQLGTSGSGNHFVEFGEFTLFSDSPGLGAGKYLALLSHSGSRGSGNAIAEYYSRVARDLCPALPRNLQALAWLEMDSEAGQEYWQAMELMGNYAAANHELIHRHIAKHLGVEVLLDVENHHNFAWKEVHDGEELIVHRKGATPAGDGIMGMIPGSMATPGYLVRGKGSATSLASASHGAGRKMSRTAAKELFAWSDAQKLFDKQGITVLSAGLDEVPMAYKDIEEVMAAQDDLVDIVARFEPKLVKMAPAGEAAED